MNKNWFSGMVRTKLHYIERGEILKKQKTIYESIHPESKVNIIGGIKRHDANNEIISFAEDAASKLNVSERTIQQEIQIAEKLTPEVKWLIMKHNIPKIDALKLARLKPEQQKIHFYNIKNK